MTQYVRLNDAVAYGKKHESPETLFERAKENINISDFNLKWLDLEISRVQGTEDEVVVYLRTLLQVESPNDELVIEERFTNNAQPDDYEPAFEIGDENYFEHIWETYSVEGEHVSELRPQEVEKLIPKT